MKTVKNIIAFTLFSVFCSIVVAQEKFPDGTLIPEWFTQNTPTDITKLGKSYHITDYGVVNDSTILQTEKIQAVIDLAAQNGGGVVIIPKGTFLTASLFFKPKTHLHLEKDAVLKGSDDIGDFPVVETRLEGQNLNYFPALVNADKVDGFTISGEGTLNGNGLRYWKSFWKRRAVNPQCTNLEELRPRLLFVSNSNDVQISGIRLINSPFWTTHFYKCTNVKLLNLYIYSPYEPVKAPSTDAIDIDACSNVLIKNCYMSVNDDAIALKGGKGPWADQLPENGGNYNIIIEDCEFGFCHGVLTFGSESIHNRNIILRRNIVSKANRLLWLKMRPDTPQNYEYVLIEDIKGDAKSFLYIKPWTQFFDLKGREDIPVTYARHITMRNVTLDCEVFFNVDDGKDQYILSDFVFENLNITTQNDNVNKSLIKNFILRNVMINGKNIN
ncbi:MAG: glycosyl hydrolase family 28 protein [Bacteroidales bacterium]|nr:glycosyl hydrolase family 28 protein [Bacteroidales bacterium]